MRPSMTATICLLAFVFVWGLLTLLGVIATVWGSLFIMFFGLGLMIIIYMGHLEEGGAYE